MSKTETQPETEPVVIGNAPTCEGEWNAQESGTKTTLSKYGKPGDDDHGILISYPDGDTKKVAWKKMQLWDVGTMNPISLYNGDVQYTVSWSSGNFVGDGIRCYGKGTKTAFMINVPEELFLYVCKCRKVLDKVATWRANAKEYTPETSTEGGKVYSNTTNPSNDDHTDAPY